MEGFSYDFFILAFTGASFYSIYCLIGYFTEISGTGTVVLGDLLFALLTSLVLLVEMYQFHIYPAGRNKMSLQAVATAIILWAFVIINIALVEVWKVIPRS